MKLHKVSFGWYSSGFEIRKSSIPGSYNVKCIKTGKRTQHVGLKRVREYLTAGAKRKP